jgi:hypothetical protein
VLALASARDEGLECPALLMTLAPGTIFLAPIDPQRWVGQMAAALSHPRRGGHWLRVVRAQRPGSTGGPAWSRRPDSWRSAIAAARNASADPRMTFIHGDYQHLNLLWSRETEYRSTGHGARQDLVNASGLKIPGVQSIHDVVARIPRARSHIMAIGNVSGPTRESAAQEAHETRAETKAEAAKGDPQAKRKLAAQQSPQSAAAKQAKGAEPPPKPVANPEGKGTKVDTLA